MDERPTRDEVSAALRELEADGMIECGPDGRWRATPLGRRRTCGTPEEGMHEAATKAEAYWRREGRNGDAQWRKKMEMDLWIILNRQAWAEGLPGSPAPTLSESD